jgi:iron(III) transport system permease protein
MGVGARLRRAGASPPRFGQRIFPLLGLLLAALVAIPILTVLRSLLLPTEGVWVELVAFALPRYLTNTAWLLFGVGVGVLLVGVGAAWLVTMCRFPGSRVCEWALLLPLAMPAYVIAYTYTDLLQFAGPVQSALRGWFGWNRNDYWFPEIRSLGGAIAMLILVLYPYAYLLARSAFLSQSVCALEASRTLGHGAWQGFFRVALPLARPAIVGGLALVMMEALADFGTVKYFEVDTFTTGIYLTWFNLGSPVGAAQLAAALLAIVLLLLGLERVSRGQRRFFEASRQHRPLAPYRLRGVRAMGALAACALPFTLGFSVPAGILLFLSIRGGDRAFGPWFVGLAFNSFALAALAGVVAVSAAAVIAYGMRLTPTLWMRATARLATIGYAVPGSVIAVGIMVPFGWFDNGVDAWARANLGWSTGLLLSGTIFALVFAYLVRFLAVSFNAVEAGLTRIRPSIDDAAATLGHAPASRLARIHVPMLRGSLLTATLLVFVDTVKELPATMIVRPFNFETLAVRVFRLASDERLAEASTASLAIVAVGIVPVIVLSMALARSRPGQPGR